MTAGGRGISEGHGKGVSWVIDEEKEREIGVW